MALKLSQKTILYDNVIYSYVVSNDVWFKGCKYNCICENIGNYKAQLVLEVGLKSHFCECVDFNILWEHSRIWETF